MTIVTELTRAVPSEARGSEESSDWYMISMASHVCDGSTVKSLSDAFTTAPCALWGHGSTVAAGGGKAS